MWQTPRLTIYQHTLNNGSCSLYSTAGAITKRNTEEQLRLPKRAAELPDILRYEVPAEQNSLRIVFVVPILCIPSASICNLHYKIAIFYEK